MTLAKGHARELGVDPQVFEKSDVHIHVPAGAVPKDGPSAGVSIFASLVSMLTQRTVQHDVAMTGEISLRGLVLPVGGIKEKVVAAARSGIKTVILPARNRRDFEDIPASVRETMRFVWAESVEDVIAAAFEGGIPHRKSAGKSAKGSGAARRAAAKRVSVARSARQRQSAAREIRLRADSPRSRDP